MPATANINTMTVVHKGSGGVSVTFPDACNTPAPSGPPIAVPYPNVAQSSDTAGGTRTVKIDGNPVCVKGSTFSTSTGDEPGSAGGLLSMTTKGEAEFVNYSFDVTIEGANGCRLLDPMMNNKGATSTNTPPIPELQPPIMGPPACEIDADTYLLSFTFAYALPRGATGKEVMPRFETGHDLSGPDSATRPSGSPYFGAIHFVAAEGSYTLELHPFDLAERSDPPDA